MNVEPIRAIDLLGFARRHEAPSFAHELVRRLISADEARAEGFAPFEGLQVKGWDGASYSEVGSHFVPAGPARWEISSINSNMQAKAESDFQHRIMHAREHESYVAVFLARWTGKLDWAAEMKATSAWSMCAFTTLTTSSSGYRRTHRYTRGRQKEYEDTCKRLPCRAPTNFRRCPFLSRSELNLKVRLRERRRGAQRPRSGAVQGWARARSRV